MSASPKPYDAQVSLLRKEGKSYEEIANILSIPKWAVGDALARLGMRKKPANFDTKFRHTKKPCVEKTCPVCGCKHMSDPVIWTCEPCRMAQSGVDESEWI